MRLTNICSKTKHFTEKKRRKKGVWKNHHLALAVQYRQNGMEKLDGRKKESSTCRTVWWVFNNTTNSNNYRINVTINYTGNTVCFFKQR